MDLSLRWLRSVCFPWILNNTLAEGWYQKQGLVLYICFTSSGVSSMSLLRQRWPCGVLPESRELVGILGASSYPFCHPELDFQICHWGASTVQLAVSMLFHMLACCRCQLALVPYAVLRALSCVGLVLFDSFLHINHNDCVCQQICFLLNYYLVNVCFFRSRERETNRLLIAPRAEKPSCF